MGGGARQSFFGGLEQKAPFFNEKSQLKNTRAKLSSSRRRLKMPAVARPLVNNTSSNFMPKRVTVLHELFLSYSSKQKRLTKVETVLLIGDNPFPVVLSDFWLAHFSVAVLPLTHTQCIVGCRVITKTWLSAAIRQNFHGRFQHHG